MADTTVDTSTDTAEVDSTATEKVEAQGTDWKAEARKWEARARSNKEAADKLAQFEDAQKTEAQKLTERADTAETELSKAQAENARLRVIAKYSVPEEYQHLVKGADEAELVAAAEAVADLAKPDPAHGRVVIPGDKTQDLPLNGEGIEAALKSALKIN